MSKFILSPDCTNCGGCGYTVEDVSALFCENIQCGTCLELNGKRLRKYVPLDEIDRVIDLSIKSCTEMLEVVTFAENKNHYANKIESLNNIKRRIHEFTNQIEIPEESAS